MSDKPQYVSVVVYIHNCAKRIEYFIDNVIDQFDSFDNCEVIFVNDCSVDNSIELIEEYYKNTHTNYIIKIIEMGKYHGMEIAMNAGRDLSIGDYVYEFDDTFVDYDKQIIMDVYNRCLEGYDVVTASTEVPIRLTSRIFYKVFNHSINTGSEIRQETFRILSRRAINRVASMGVDIPYRKVIYLNSGLANDCIKYTSLTGERPPRITEKYERVNLAFDSFIYFTNTMQKGAMIVALIFFVISCAATIYAIVSRINGYHIGEGYLSTMIFLSLGFTGIFIMFAIVVRYLSVIVDLVFKRQRYLITGVRRIETE